MKKQIQNRHPLAIDAQQEWEDEQREIEAIDRSNYVYKFRTFDSGGFTLKGLSNCTLWSSDYKSFNDAFEFRFQFDRHPAFTDKLYDQLRQDYPQYRDTMARKMVPFYGLDIMKSLLDGFGISCFSKNPLNPLMWSYYADSHRGICLGFEFPAVDEGNLALDAVHNVRYSAEPKVFNLSIFFKPSTTVQKLRPFVTTKHKIWKHEDESRYVGFGKAKKPVNYRPDALKEIIFGTNTPKEHKAEIEAICASNGWTPRFYDAQMNSGSYSLSLCQID